jgi:hypothetical protein
VYSFLTLIVDGGECLASHPGRFADGKESPVPIVLEAGKSDDIGGHLHHITGSHTKDSFPEGYPLS